MLTIALTWITSFFGKYKKYIIGSILILGLIWYVLNLRNKVEYLSNENNRKDNNIENMNFDIKQTKLKNGELQYSVKSLTLKRDELENFNKNIFDALNQMDLKIKNIKAVTNIDYTYITNIKDTLKSTKIDNNNLVDDNYLINFDKDKNNKLTFNGIISIPKDYPKNSPFLSDINVTFNDSLLIVPEIIYKRRWLFWKKATGVKMNIKSENPNFFLNKLQTYEFKD